MSGPREGNAAVIEGPLLNQSALGEAILRSLPAWFGIEQAIVDYLTNMATLPTFVARRGQSPAARDVDDALGFMSLKQHFPRAAELYVLGVRPEAHRVGIGRALLTRCEAWLIDQGVEYLQVKTLGPSRPNAEYERTRLFYEAMGFQPLEELKTLWGERNPCLMMVKRLPALDAHHGAEDGPAREKRA